MLQTTIVCPKCDYVRTKEDIQASAQEGSTLSPYECPQCGILYEKYYKKIIKGLQEENVVMRQEVVDIKFSYRDIFPESIVFAPLAIRVLAILIDIFVLVFPAMLIFSSVNLMLEPTNPGEAIFARCIGVGEVLVGGWLYCTFCHASSWQATVGKRIMGLQIVTKDGGAISLIRAALRYIVSILSWIVLGMGYAVIPCSREKQGLHDMITETYIIRTKK